jgi:hypothetical protein
MRTAYDKGISLLDNCVRITAQPLTNSLNHIYLAPKQRNDLQLQDLANANDLTLTPATLKLHNQEIVELLIQLISYPINSRKTPWFDDRRFKQYRNINLGGCATFSHLLKESRNTHLSESIQRAMLSDYPGLMDDHVVDGTTGSSRTGKRSAI